MHTVESTIASFCNGPRLAGGRNASGMQTTNGSATPTTDWREWAAFLGYVLVAALLISIALASIVLVLTVPTDEDSSATLVSRQAATSTIAPASLNKPALLPAQVTRLEGATLPVKLSQ